MTTKAQRLAQSPEIYTLDDNVRLDRCFIDLAYQRAVDPQRVNALIAGWVPNGFGVILVSLRPDGRYAVLDGGHRCEAARAVLGVTATVPAKVYIDLTVTEEAELFLLFNRERRPPSQLQQFHARLAAAEEQAIAIRDLVLDAGLQVASPSNPGERGTIAAVWGLEQCVKQYGFPLSGRALGVLAEGFGDAQGALLGELINGTAGFLLRYEGVLDRKRLVTKMRELGPRALMTRAKTVRAAFPAYTTPSCAGIALRELYNEHLRSGTLDEWRSRVFSEVGLASAADRGRRSRGKPRAPREEGPE